MVSGSSLAPAPCIALNLCDVTGVSPLQTVPLVKSLALLAQRAARDAQVERFDRIYVGSYFCDRLFGTLTPAFFEAVRSLASSLEASLTLVAPLFGQRTYQEGVNRIHELMKPGSAFDELVVNDEPLARSMHAWLVDAYPAAPERPRLGRGRLMAKGWRDPRYGAPATPVVLPLDAQQAAVECAAWHPAFAEVDPFAPSIDASPLAGMLPLALHLPHAVLTTGHICKAASVGLPASRAFRAGAPCARPCLSGIDVFQSPSLHTEAPVFLTQQGRTVFFENPDCQVYGAPVARVIWSPADYGCPTLEEGALAWA